VSTDLAVTPIEVKFFGGTTMKSLLVMLGLSSLFFLTGCGDVFNADQGVSFTSYNSLTAQAMGEGAGGLNQLDDGLASGPNGGLGINDDGFGNNDEPTSPDDGVNNPDGGLANNNNNNTPGSGMTPTFVPGPLMPLGAGTNPTLLPPMVNPGLMTPVLPGTPGNPTTNNIVRPEEDNVLVGTNINLKCQAGEIDMIRVLMNCQPSQNLIATMKDSMGEVLLENFGNLNEKENVESIIEELKAMDAAEATAGRSVELFLCLDSDGDNSCMDEEVTDLNEHNDTILMAVRMFDKSEKKQQSFVAKACAADKLGKLTNGLVLYHQEFVDSSQEVSASGVIQRMVADEMNQFVKNLTEETDAEEIELGTKFSMTLVQADKTQCKQINKRMHGCFIEGTKISLNKSDKLEIQDLQVGDSVYLSNGTKSKIQKIVKGPEVKPVVEVQLLTGESLTVTDTHPMLTEAGVVQAKDLSIGHRLLTEKGHWAPIQSLSTKKYDGLVYNIELGGDREQDHLVYGNGVVTGDLYLQQQLQKPAQVGIHFTLAK
jgi:hypothetical protein